MASINTEFFTIVDSSGAPLSGQSVSWNTLQSINSTGTATAVVGADRPLIIEVGSTGIYRVAGGLNLGAIPAGTRLVGVLDCGSSAAPRYQFFDVRHEDRNYEIADISADLSTLQGDVTTAKGYALSAKTAAESVDGKVPSTLSSDLIVIKASAQDAEAAAEAVNVKVPSTLTADVAEIKSDVNEVQSDLAAIDLVLTKVRKALLNTSKIDAATNKYVLYEDDGITEFASFNLKDSTGVGSTTSIYERIKI